MKQLGCPSCGKLFEVDPWPKQYPIDWPRFHSCPYCSATVPEYIDQQGAVEKTPLPPDIPLNPKAIGDLLAFALSEDHPDRQEVEDRLDTDTPPPDGAPCEDELPPISPIDEQDRLFRPNSTDQQ